MTKMFVITITRNIPEKMMTQNYANSGFQELQKDDSKKKYIWNNDVENNRLRRKSISSQEFFRRFNGFPFDDDNLYEENKFKNDDNKYRAEDPTTTPKIKIKTAEYLVDKNDNKNKNQSVEPPKGLTDYVQKIVSLEGEGSIETINYYDDKTSESSKNNNKKKKVLGEQQNNDRKNKEPSQTPEDENKNKSGKPTKVVGCRCGLTTKNYDNHNKKKNIGDQQNNDRENGEYNKTPKINRKYVIEHLVIPILDEYSKNGSKVEENDKHKSISKCCRNNFATKTSRHSESKKTKKKNSTSKSLSSSSSFSSSVSFFSSSSSHSSSSSSSEE